MIGIRYGTARNKCGVEQNRDSFVIKNIANHFGVPIFRDSLEGLVVITVIIVESDRDPFDKGGGKFSRLMAPLFFCVAVEERAVKIMSDHLQCLFFKVRWGADSFVSDGGDKLARLRRIKRLAEKLIDRVQVDRK